MAPNRKRNSPLAASGKPQSSIFRGVSFDHLNLCPPRERTPIFQKLAHKLFYRRFAARETIYPSRITCKLARTTTPSDNLRSVQVSLHKGTLKYRANIKIKGRKIALGAYDNEVDAAKAFDRAALRFRGIRAELNFPIARRKTDSAVSTSPFQNADTSVSIQSPRDCNQSLPHEKDALRRSSRSLAKAKSGKLENEASHRSMELEQNLTESPELPDLPKLLLDLDNDTVEEVIEPDFPSIYVNALGGEVPLADMQYIHADSDSAGGTIDRLMSQPSIRSHGLSVLDARGFDLREPTQEALDGIALPQPSGHDTVECSSQKTFSDYRTMLIHRSMAGAEEDVYLSEGDQWGAMSPVTFLGAPALPSKNAWWRRQLQTAIENDARTQMLTALQRQPSDSSDDWRQPPYCEYPGPSMLSYHQLQAF